MTFQVLTYGATIFSVRAPDNKGKIEDVCLGFDDMNGIQIHPNTNGTICKLIVWILGYLSNEDLYFGSTVGRVCNRIANAQFYLNGKEYKLAKTQNGNQLHGGLIGFHKFNWTPFVIDNKVIYEV